MNKAVFFDRDGVINNDKDYYYVLNPDMFHINEGIIDLLKYVQEKNFLTIIVSNQGGIAKDLYSIEDVENIHKKMTSILADKNLIMNEIYYCPHHPQVSKCICRKPGTLFIEKAISRFNIDPALSYFVGDRDTDVEAGRNAGLITIKVERNANLVYLKELIN